MSTQFNSRTKRRGIEWCDETRNATGGCLHDCKWQMPDGTVAVCYAKELAENGPARVGYPNGFEHHYWRESGLKELTKGKEPLLIFPDSMSDMFAHYVPDDQVHKILSAMASAPHHTYQSLTKAPPQLLKYADALPPNLWVGVSSPPDWFMGKRLTLKQQEAMLAQSLKILRRVKQHTGCIVWMSAEPVSWDLTSVIGDDHPLDWIVIGAASNGPRYFEPDPQHIAKLLTVMDATDTAVFYKGNIKKMFAAHDLGTAELNRWREDFPICYRDGRKIPAVTRRQAECKLHCWTTSRPYAPRWLDMPTGNLPVG